MHTEPEQALNNLEEISLVSVLALTTSKQEDEEDNLLSSQSEDTRLHRNPTQHQETAILLLRSHTYSYYYSKPALL